MSGADDGALECCCINDSNGLNITAPFLFLSHTQDLTAAYSFFFKIDS